MKIEHPANVDCMAQCVGIGEIELQECYLRVDVWMIYGQTGSYLIHHRKSWFGIFESTMVGRIQHLHPKEYYIVINSTTLSCIKKICQTAYPKFAWRWIHDN